MAMMTKCLSILMGALLCLAPALAGAEADAQYFGWTQEFPPLPQLEHHAYTVELTDPDGDALAEAAWPGQQWSRLSEDAGGMYVLEAADNELRGMRELISVEPGHALYSKILTEYPELDAIGGPEAAYQQAYAAASSMLPESALTCPLPLYSSYDENGEELDRFYEVMWLAEVEPGVYGASPLVSATVYPGYVNYVGYNPRSWLPVESMAAPTYISAEQALASLNYVAGHIDPAHTCTTFDDPEDEVVMIYPAFVDCFSDSGEYTLSWAFLIRDARLGYTRTVWVDAVSGDVYDEHDGRLQGAISNT